MYTACFYIIDESYFDMSCPLFIFFRRKLTRPIGLIKTLPFVVVDGSTSCIPMQFSAQASQEQGYEQPWEAGATAGTDTDGFENSPMSSSSRKRGNTSTSTSGESPSKKKKEPLLKTMFTGIIEKFDEDRKDANDNLA